MGRPRGITLRITLLGWLVTLVTLFVFVMVIVPGQKREFELSLESKARGIAVSIRGVAAGAAVSADYSAVVDQAMQVLSGDVAIDYVIMTKNDGFSIVVDRSAWKTAKLGGAWLPASRAPASSIGVSPLFGRRVFQYAFPFDYSGIEWGWIHIGLSLDTYDASVRRTYEGTGILTVLCGVLSLIISLGYAAHLVRPIQVLRSAVERLAQGDLHARAEVHSRDEIERLAEAFNGMAQTILGRNRILESVSFAAKQFLSDGDRDTVLEEVLEKVGQAAGAGRACVLKMCVEEGCPRPSLQREWLPPGASSPREGWEMFPWRAEGAERWVQLLRQGLIVTVTPAGVEEAIRDRIDVRIRSTIFVPVVVAGEWWGIVGFDDFLQEREWGDAERDSLRAVADMLGASITRNRARQALVEAKETLETRVAERTRELQDQVYAKERARAELAEAQQRMIELSRLSGMAEVATGVLHNVGNVLNSVNVSTNIVVGKIREFRVENLITARVSGLIEDVCLADLIEDAFQIVQPSFERHEIRLERDFQELPRFAADKHKILQILLNLLRNAKEAVKQSANEPRFIRVSVRLHDDDRVRIEVKDSGVGLAPENLTRIFAHGFTTKSNGHGFGLHSGALAAQQMSGSLRAESDGPGHGATFILELPLGTIRGKGAV